MTQDPLLVRDRNLVADEQRRLSAMLDWLPSKVFDAHAHNYLSEHIGDIPERAKRHIINTYQENSLLDSYAMRSILFPERHVSTLRFSHAMPGVDFCKVNDWLRSSLISDDRFALFGLQYDVEYTINLLQSRPAALKQYYFITEPPGKVIYEVFPQATLAICQELSVPIILHLPVPLPDSTADVVQLARDFPRLVVVLAHAGVALQYSLELDEAYATLSKFPNIFFDTALVDDARVLMALLKAVGTQRVMFGTDEPLNWIRAVTYVNPQLGPRLAPRAPYSWTDMEEFQAYGSHGSNAVQWHWAAIDAIRTALLELSTQERASATRQIFHDNAVGVYG